MEAVGGGDWEGMGVGEAVRSVLWCCPLRYLWAGSQRTVALLTRLARINERVKSFLTSFLLAPIYVELISASKYDIGLEKKSRFQSKNDH